MSSLQRRKESNFFAWSSENSFLRSLDIGYTCHEYPSGFSFQACAQLHTHSSQDTLCYFPRKKRRNKVRISFLGVFLGSQDVDVKATKTSVEEVESESKKFGWGVSKSIILMMTNISKINLASKLFFCQSAPLTMRTMMNHRNHQQNMTLSQKTSTSSRMLTRTKKFSIKLDFFRLVYFFYWNSGCL